MIAAQMQGVVTSLALLATLLVFVGFVSLLSLMIYHGVSRRKKGRFAPWHVGHVIGADPPAERRLSPPREGSATEPR